MKTVARSAIETAKKKGASAATARVYKVRDVTVNWRDGKLEQLNEATTRGLGINLYVDGRYASVSTSDLRPEAIDTFIADSVAMTRTLAVDPFRELPDPSLYRDRPTVDLKLSDPRYSDLSAAQRRQIASDIEKSARAVKGAEAFLSVTTGINDTRAESYRVTSNGFEGERVDTSFWIYASVSVKDSDGRRPEDSDFAGVRFLGELPSAETIGRGAAERSLARLGSKKADSKVMTMILDNRAGGRMVGALMGPLGGASIQQRRSFLEGKAGEAIGSPLLSITDDPLIPKAC
jgi:PmbA protein